MQNRPLPPSSGPCHPPRGPGAVALGRPVAELETLVPYVVVARQSVHEVNPSLGGAELSFQDLRITEPLVQGPWGQHGHITQTAPGRAGVHILCAGMTGTYQGTVPSASCSMATSRSHETSMPEQSYKKVAVGANAWMSPVQPRTRSSRCGQSVGMSTEFPLIPHTMLS